MQILMANKDGPLVKPEEKIKAEEKNNASSQNGPSVKILASEIEAIVEYLHCTNPEEYKELSNALCARFLPATRPFDPTGVFSGCFALFLFFFQLYLLHIVGLPATIAAFLVSGIIMMLAGIDLSELGNNLGITSTICGSLIVALSMVIASPLFGGPQPNKMDIGTLLFAFTFVSAAFMISSVTRYVATIVLSTTTFIAMASINASVLAGGIYFRSVEVFGHVSLTIAYLTLVYVTSSFIFQHAYRSNILQLGNLQNCLMQE